MKQYKSFFHFQRTALVPLWRWGLGSVAAGLLALFSRNTVVRHAGIQALAWGVIDALLAFFGQRDARRKIDAGMPGQAQAARRFRTILLINAGLDVAYIVSGVLLVQRANGRAERTGMGLGVLVQGLFLLLLDTTLAARTGPWVAKES